MEQPTYLRRLIRQKWLLIVGAVVAVVAGLLAGFTIVDGQVQSRVVQTYMASSTVLLTSPNPEIFQTEIPATTQALPDPAATPAAPQELIVREATPLNLSDSAIILAYLASSDEVVDAVGEAVGGLEDGDGLTAVRRTTQPAGDEQFGGRLSLPIIDIVGVSTSAERAELIAAEATGAFGDLVAAEQAEWGVPEDIRLMLDEINAPVAGEPEGSNPVIPVIVTAVGVFLVFIALALIIEAVRDARRKKRESAAPGADAASDEPADDVDDVDDVFRVTPEPRREPQVVTARARRRRTETGGADAPATAPSEGEPAEPVRR